MSVEGRGRNEEIGIGEQVPASIQLRIEGRRALDDTIGQGEDETDVAQGVEGDLLDVRLFGFEPTQNLIARDDGEGEPVMVSQVEPCALGHQRMLFEEFRQDIRIEEGEPLGH